MKHKDIESQLGPGRAYRCGVNPRELSFRWLLSPEHGSNVSGDKRHLRLECHEIRTHLVYNSLSDFCPSGWLFSTSTPFPFWRSQPQDIFRPEHIISYETEDSRVQYQRGHKLSDDQAVAGVQSTRSFI